MSISKTKLLFYDGHTRWPGKAISGFCVIAIFARACAAMIRPASVPSLARTISDCNTTRQNITTLQSSLI